MEVALEAGADDIVSEDGIITVTTFQVVQQSSCYTMRKTTVSNGNFLTIYILFILKITNLLL